MTMRELRFSFDGDQVDVTRVTGNGAAPVSPDEALLEAADKGLSEVVTHLLDAGLDGKAVNVDASNKRRQTALHLAMKPVWKWKSMSDHYFQIVKRLLRAEANPNFQDSEGKTPLHYAVDFDFENALDLLLGQDRLDIDVRDNIGNSPLHYAVGSPYLYSSERLVSVYLKQKKYGSLAPILLAAYQKEWSHGDHGVREIWKQHFRRLLHSFLLSAMQHAEMASHYLDGGCRDNIIQNQRKAHACPFFASNDFYETSIREYTDWLAWAVTTRETIDELREKYDGLQAKYNDLYPTPVKIEEVGGIQPF